MLYLLQTDLEPWIAYRAAYHWIRVASGGQRKVHQRLTAVDGEALQLALVFGLPSRVQQHPEPLQDLKGNSMRRAIISNANFSSSDRI